MREFQFPDGGVKGGFSLHITSIGGRETCIYVPTYKAVFDIGMCPERVVGIDRVFFSHCHADHMASAIHHMSLRAQRRLDPATYYVPWGSRTRFLDYIKAWERLATEKVALDQNKVIAFHPKMGIGLGEGTMVQPFRATHRTRRAFGFGVVRGKKKLFPEFEGRQDLIEAAVKRGDPVTSLTLVTEFAFSGDTTLEVLDGPHGDYLRKAQVLVLEVTFLDDRVSVDDARAGGHVHIRDLAARLDEFECKHIICSHPSQRYRGENLEELYDAAIPNWRERNLYPLAFPRPR